MLTPHALPARQFANINIPARATALVTFGLMLVLISACGKSERVVTTEERLKSVQSKQETQPDFYAPRKTVDYMADLKSIRESGPKPDAVAKPDAAGPAKIDAAKSVAADTRPATPPPAPVVAPVQPAPAAVAAASPATVVAAVAPRPAADTTVTVINREQPGFPREAIRQNIEGGLVRARVNINAAGDPTLVSIVSARPARVFDREVQAALMKWKFNAGTEGRSYETEFNFQR